MRGGSGRSTLISAPVRYKNSGFFIREVNVIIHLDLELPASVEKRDAIVALQVQKQSKVASTTVFLNGHLMVHPTALRKPALK